MLSTAGFSISVSVLALFCLTHFISGECAFAASDEKAKSFGEKFTPKESEIISSEKLNTDDPKFQNTKESEQIIEANVAEVCRSKGCWMNVEAKDRPLHVTFKDYGFFVPQSLKGQKVLMKGKFVEHTESVSEQKHLLKDAGRPDSEIAAVKEPRKILQFVASGVVIK